MIRDDMEPVAPSSPFRYRVSEEHFLTKLALLILGECVMPEDDKWHRVELRFDMLSPAPRTETGRARVQPGGFLLGGSSDAG